jgi:hypothetical protein
MDQKQRSYPPQPGHGADAQRQEVYLLGEKPEKDVISSRVLECKAAPEFNKYLHAQIGDGTARRRPRRRWIQLEVGDDEV